MELPLVLLLTALAVVGAAVGVGLAVSDKRHTRTGKEHEPGLVRVTASVHTGWEQSLIGLHRELGLPRQGSDLAYGALYLEPLHEQRLLVRSRSEIGRGFLGAVDILPARGRTGVVYRILRLPGDEQVRDRVLGFELQLVSALRRVDRTVEVQIVGGPLRDAELPPNVELEQEDRRQ